jgi:D-tyrosyl-tRNA(Tyr) deacylase
MRAVLQRVKRASVSVDSKIVGSTGKGLLIFFGAEEADTKDDFDYILKKCAGMRIFSDENGKMNLSLKDVGGGVLCVSQFTLLADIRRGNRPSFTRAMNPSEAEKLYDDFCTALASETGCEVQKGVFGADMEIEAINDGPVTIIADSRNR